MSYEIDPHLEYFIGISLPEKESEFVTTLRSEIEKRDILSSPPHITIKPPFLYHFEKPLTEQLEKWSLRQWPFEILLKKIATFKHHNYASIVLIPEQGRPIKKLEQNLSKRIKFLPEQVNFTPHLTIANKVEFDHLDEVKKYIRSFNLKLEFIVDNITLFQHQRLNPWVVKEVFKFGITTKSGIKRSL